MSQVNVMWYHDGLLEQKKDIKYRVRTFEYNTESD